MLSEMHVTFILEGRNYPNYAKTAENQHSTFKALGYNLSLKLHFLHSHLEIFPDNMGTFRIHQDVADMEYRYRKK